MYTHTYIYTHIVKRKYDTPGCGKGDATLWPSADYSSKQELQDSGMVSLIKRMPKEKTCPRGKRQLLILVLSEIKRVSFYQRVMEAQ